MEKNERGFTLLELVVALAIFAIMSVCAYRGLNMLLQTHAQVSAEGEKWHDISLLFMRLQQDINQSAKRTELEQRLLQTQSEMNVLLKGTIHAMKARYLNTTAKGWEDTNLGQEVQNEALPLAVEITLELSQGERVNRLFALQ